MALTNASHESFFTKSGSAADKVSSGKLAEIKDLWDKDVASGANLNLLNDPTLGPLLYQMQQMQDELTYLRTEIDANKDKTGITSGQASAITANTAKVSLAGGSATTLSFGEMITTITKKGTVYDISMTATKSGVSKSVKLTLA